MSAVACEDMADIQHDLAMYLARPDLLDEADRELIAESTDDLICQSASLDAVGGVNLHWS